jgi:hypothetical protein
MKLQCRNRLVLLQQTNPRNATLAQQQYLHVAIAKSDPVFRFAQCETKIRRKYKTSRGSDFEKLYIINIQHQVSVKMGEIVSVVSPAE